MLKEIDLNDPTTKALYDTFPEDRKDEFEDAYAYLKDVSLGIGAIKSLSMPGVPLSEGLTE